MPIVTPHKTKKDERLLAFLDESPCPLLSLVETGRLKDRITKRKGRCQALTADTQGAVEGTRLRAINVLSDCLALRRFEVRHADFMAASYAAGMIWPRR